MSGQKTSSAIHVLEDEMFGRVKVVSYLVVYLCVVTSTSIRSHGQERARPSIPSIEPEDLKLATFCLAGMWAELEKLQSGRFRATSLRPIWNHETHEIQTNRDSDIDCVFDNKKLSLRFDRTWRTQSLEDPTPLRTNYIRTGEQSVAYLGGLDIGIGKPDYKHVVAIETFDVRTIGLLAMAEHEGNYSLSRAREYYNRQKKAVGIERVGDSVYRLTLQIWPPKDAPFSDSRARQLIWLDERKGFLPIRLQTEGWFRKDRDPIEYSWAKMETLEIDWQKQSGAWIPKVAVWRDREDLEKNTLTFEWDSVNEPVAERFFDYHDFNARDGTRVLDRRRSPPEYVEVIHAGDTLVESQASGTVWRIILGVTIPGLVVGLAWVYYRRRQK